MNTGVRVTYGQRNIETKHIECASSIVFCLMNFFFVYSSTIIVYCFMHKNISYS